MNLTHNSEAYREGSTCPPVDPNIVRLYSMRFCPYAERIRLILNHLKIKCEIVNINTNSKPKWFLDLNKDGTIPIIQYQNVILSQSLICNEFLVEEFCKCYLARRKPIQRALQRMLMERFDKVTDPYFAIVKTNDESVHKENIQKLYKELRVFEDELKGPFFGDKRPCLVDFAMWPWFERFPAAKKVTGLDLLPGVKFPRLNNWRALMEKSELVQLAALPLELHAEYICKKQAGSTSVNMADIGLSGRFRQL